MVMEYTGVITEANNRAGTSGGLGPGGWFWPRHPRHVLDYKTHSEPVDHSTRPPLPHTNTTSGESKAGGIWRPPIITGSSQRIAALGNWSGLLRGTSSSLNNTVYFDSTRKILKVILAWLVYCMSVFRCMWYQHYERR